MNSWVYGLVVEGWSDVGLLVDKRQLAGLECFEESEGQASRGWNCLFSDMPHLCVFNTTAVSLRSHLPVDTLRGRVCNRGAASCSKAF